MPDLMRAAGENITVELGGKEYTLSPITIGDLAAFEKRVKEEKLQRFLDVALRVGMDKEERIEGITRILSIPFTSEDFATALSTIDGVRFLLFRSLRRNHKHFKIEQIDKMGNLEDLMTVVNSISNLGRMTESPPEPGASKG